jgi:hypothetical protein
MARLHHALGLLFVFGTMLAPAAAQDGRQRVSSRLAIVDGVERQPLAFHVQRLIDAASFLGVPFDASTRQQLAALAEEQDSVQFSLGVQKALDAHCLAGVSITPDGKVKTAVGPANPRLVENGWTHFLIKVHNEAGVQLPLRCDSASALPVPKAPADAVAGRWLELAMHNDRPMTPRLRGAKLGYRFLQLYSRDRGQRSAAISFVVETEKGAEKTFEAANDVAINFECARSTPVTFLVKDHDGEPTIASFLIRDERGRVYPSQAKRLAPDFFFHPQVYRADGETVGLPPGTFSVEFTRGPEYLKLQRTISVGSQPSRESFQLKRWIDPAKHGYWSGDHHIHAAGCSHYEDPTEGVMPADMMRHCRGEDLKVGCVLTWGPCFDYQKRFFTGHDHALSELPYLMRYDVEVSGFGSHQSGHLCLLRLRDQIPPGGSSKYHWPTLGLNTLRWAKSQGAVCGPAHSGWGLTVETRELPNYVIPPFDSIGANEYIVDVTHTVPGPDGADVPAVDFISTVDTVPTWELNIWYHTLNCGFRTRASGETDFPCIFDRRVGIGRSYVKLDQKLDYDQWCEGIRKGRSYVGDGLSHLLDFTVNGTELGTSDSEVHLDGEGRVHVEAQVAAFLDADPEPEWEGNRAIPTERWDRARTFWHIERARIGHTRTVPVELIVNGEPVARAVIEADGRLQPVEFDVEVAQSSWLALRILASSHTNPIFVMVGDKPIRASRKSAEWCLKCVDQCWTQKERFYATAEMDDAIAAYDHARKAYRRILAECP